MAKTKRKVKKVRGRRLIQLFFAAISNSYVTGFAAGKIYGGNLKNLCAPGLNCYSCPGALLSCPIGSLQAVIGSRAFSMSLYVFGLITLFGALMGRMICGFLCPFGWIQELIYRIPFPIKRNHFRGDRPLRKLKYLLLVVLVFLLPMVMNNEAGNAPPTFCKYVCPAGTLEAGIPLVSLSRLNERRQPEAKLKLDLPSDFSAGFSKGALPKTKAPEVGVRGLKVGFLFWWKVGILLVILFSSLLTYRPFCKYLCPLGAMYGILNPVAFYRLRLDENLCIHCGRCRKACKMCLDPVKQLNHPECVRCGDCVNVCPVNALSMGFGAGRPKAMPCSRMAAKVGAPIACQASGGGKADCGSGSKPCQEKAKPKMGGKERT